jgi:hypothetical protein
MTVTFKEEISESRRARNTQGSRSYTRAFRLETSLQSEDCWDVGSHASLPVIGDTYPSDANAYCHDIQIDNSDPWKGWIATYEYSDARQITGANQAGTGVLDEILYSFNTQTYQRRTWVDRNDAGLTNSAEDPILEGAYIDQSRVIIRVEFNIVAVPVGLLNFVDKINTTAISIIGLPIPAGGAKFAGFNVGNRKIRGVYPTGPNAGDLITYYPMSYEIQFDPYLWIAKIDDKGLMDKDGSSIKDADDEDVRVPVFLSSGIKLPKGGFSIAREFHLYKTIDFSTLIGVD